MRTAYKNPWVQALATPSKMYDHANATTTVLKNLWDLLSGYDNWTDKLPWILENTLQDNTMLPVPFITQCQSSTNAIYSKITTTSS